MKHTGIGIVALALFVGVAYSCGDPSEPTEDSDVLFPLAVVNYWVGEWTAHPKTGDPGTIRDTIRVVSDTVVDGERWFRISSSIDSLEILDEWARNSPSGVLEGLPGERMYYTYPAAENDTFSTFQNEVVVPDPNPDNEPATVTQVVYRGVTGVSHSITVPAGQFACNGYRPFVELMSDSGGVRFRRNIYEDWLAPGVGPVRIDSYDDSDELLGRWQLEEYVVQ